MPFSPSSVNSSEWWETAAVWRGRHFSFLAWVLLGISTYFWAQIARSDLSTVATDHWDALNRRATCPKKIFTSSIKVNLRLCCKCHNFSIISKSEFFSQDFWPCVFVECACSQISEELCQETGCMWSMWIFSSAAIVTFFSKNFLQLNILYFLSACDAVPSAVRFSDSLALGSSKSKWGWGTWLCRVQLHVSESGVGGGWVFEGVGQMWFLRFAENWQTAFFNIVNLVL